MTPDRPSLDHRSMPGPCATPADASPLLNGRTLALTGAGGFIGQVVARSLRREGARVRALVGPSDCDPAALPSDIVTHRADITEFEPLSELFRGADTVVHVAGPPSVADSVLQPFEHARSHVLGTVAVLQACRQLRIRRLLYLSSAEVYGQPPGTSPVDELQAPAPRSPYGASKLAAEQFIAAAARTGDLVPVVLRPFSIWGPGMSATSLMATVLRQAEQADAIRVHDLRPVRDFCHVDDLARAVILACANPPQHQLLCNIGSGRGVSVRQLIEAVLCSVGRDLPVHEDANARRPSGSEVLSLVADVRQAASALGWQPQITLTDGLRRLLAWRQQALT